MNTGSQHRITWALAVGLATAVIVAMYVLRVHALRIEPGLLRVEVGTLHPHVPDLLTVTVYSNKRLITEFTPKRDGSVLVPDLARGVYRVTLSYLDFRLAERTIEIRGDEGASWLQSVRIPFVPQPPGVVNKADVLKDAPGHPRWRVMLGLGQTESPHILSVSRVFVSHESTQAIVFVHDWCPHCGRGDLFWLTRATSADAWTIERVDLLWIS